MKRRRLLAAVGASAALGTSGCLEAPRTAPEPKDHPAPPERLTADSVVDFVEAYETVEYHNEVLSNEHNPDSVTVGCTATLDRETESGFYVLTSCGGSATRGDVIADYGGDGGTYRVTEDRVQRVFAPVTDADGSYRVLLVNFDDTEHDLTAVVSSTPESADEPLLDVSHTLDSEQAVFHHVDRDEMVAGELTISLEGTETTVDDVFSGSEGMGVYITANEIDIGALP